ncbi:septum formation initiator family protein [Corynebacterium sp. HMSC034A01]|uniref:septum formation initiator family protein n=1 Tax=Corynebacterium sp. HMSC034A01 TaxID=1739295 RepID=UPI0008AA3417|nr:septum formation initiator family protein [Corynebacterium sp. HMSC034A01]OHR24283.1 hypothetical protein HMPREF2791_00100 [Corynebacterium sp. HMSC034A01]
MTKRSRTRRPSTVPVASRDRENAERAARHKQRGRAIAFPKQDMASVVILIAVLILVLLAIAAPLRNFYEGRAEIARANESIARLEAQKKALEDDIAMYDDDAFLKQEARRRLGVMEEGETAWRIIDPRMTAPEAITTGKDDIPDTRTWPQVMWDSLREVPTEELPPIDDAPPAPAPEAPAAPEGPVPEEAPGAPEAPAPEAPAPAQ